MRGILWREFTRARDRNGLNYFSESVAGWADGVLGHIGRWFREGRITWPEYAVLVSSLIETLDRAANTTGVYAACLKSPPRVQKISRVKMIIETRGPVGSAYHMDAVDALERIPCNLAYLDPPYNARQYPSYYHIPEIVARLPLCDGEAAAEALVNSTKMLPHRDSSIFASKVGAAAAFEDLFQRCAAPRILLSYSNDGIVSLEDILEMMDKCGWDTKVYSVPHRRYRSSAKTSRKPVMEYLVFAENDGRASERC